MDFKPKTELNKKYIEVSDMISNYYRKCEYAKSKPYEEVSKIENLLNEMHNTIILLCEERYTTPSPTPSLYPSITNIDDDNFVFYLKNYIREYGEDTVLRVGLICDIIDLLYSRSENLKKENREKWLQTMKSYTD